MSMIKKLILEIITYLISIIDYSNKSKIISFFKKKFNFNELIVIDIGAHKGETIDLFIRNFKINKIYAFEPNKRLFNKLEYKKNKINKNVAIYNLGVGEKNEIKILNIMIDTASSTFNELNTNTDYFKKKQKILSFFLPNSDLINERQKIKIVNLSNFISDNNIVRLDILKIDTEGFEFNILKGLNKDDFKKIRYIYFEHHYDLMIKKKYKFSDINNLLKINNFKIKYKLKMKFRKSFEYIYENSTTN